MTEYNADYENQELDQMLYAREAEIKSFEDLENQRGTTIPALFSTMYKFVQNPSSVSVETYKRMIDTDDTIGSGIDFLTTCLAGRLGEYSHPNKEVAEFVKKALKKVNGGWFNAVKELLSATWAGFAVQEKVWANDEQMGFIIKKLVSLPPTTMMFETERTGELTQDGILQYQRNWNPMLLGTGLGYYGGLLGVGFGFSPTGDSRPDPFAKLGDMPFPLRTNNSYSYLSIRIPKQKCVHYSFDAQGKFGNPYGRALALDTPIFTANGWKTMEKIEVGEYLFDEKGSICRVVEKSEVWQDRPVYKVTFSDGTCIEADENHQWLVKSNRERYADKDSSIRTTKEMFESMNSDASKDKVFSIDVCEPLQTPKQTLLIEPYVLGMWLGDGNSNGSMITTHMDDVEEQKQFVIEDGYEVGETKQNGDPECKGRRFRIFSNMQTKLRVLNLINDKHIPEEYLTASKDQRIKLLQGLMDSDGFIMKPGYQFKDGWVSKGGHASFANCNYNLIEGVATLVRSLGMTCTIAPKKRGWGTNWKLDAWEVRFTPVDIPCFRLKRKLEKQQIEASARSGLVYIKNISRVDNKDTVCIQVDSESHLFLAGAGLTPTHNSLLRRCYKFYVLKDSILQMLAVALDRKGTPLTIVYADPNTTLADETKATAINNGGNIKGRRAGIRADEAAHAVFSRIHNDSVMILPGKKGQIYEVEALPQGSNSGEFIQSLDFCNKSIMRALLIPALMFGGDGGGSYSLGQEHTKTFMKVLDGMLDGLKEVLIQDVVTELIQYNYPRAVWEKDGFGDFSHAEFADEDLEKLSRIWETAINNGVIDTNELKDLNKMRGVMGFDERETPIEKQAKGGLFDGLDTADI